jgi:hypothetical protein
MEFEAAEIRTAIQIHALPGTRAANFLIPQKITLNAKICG